MLDKTILMVAGEASGDLHAGNLANALLKLEPSLKLKGMGSEHMRDAGVDVLIDASQLAVVGIVEVLAKYKIIKAALNKLKDIIRTTPPDLLILVDYQEFNQKLAAFAKKQGVKVLFYIGPQVWAWRPKRVHKMAKIVDQMAVILPFEVELYKEANVPVKFTGHPLLDTAVADKTLQQAKTELQITDNTTIGIFPGSRHGEIKRVLPVLLQAAALIKHQLPQVQFILPLARTLMQHDLDDHASELQALNVRIIENNTYTVMQACDVIMTASGTATLEIGLMGTPMVIVYRIAALSHFILRHLVNISHIGLVNIVSEKEIVREFIQKDAKPENIANEVLAILQNADYNRNMRNEMGKLREKLGSGGGSENLAQLVLEMLQHN